MTNSRSSLVLCSATLLCVIAPFARANTYVVDDSGGPGVDFTTISAAIAAAAPGDVLLVNSGNYASFTLLKGLAILGDGGVFVSGYPTISAVPAGEVAALTDIHVGTMLRVHNCIGTVIVQRVIQCGFEVFDSRDVRLWSVDALPHYTGWFTPSNDPAEGAALVTRSSRCEVVQSAMHGVWGPGDENAGVPGSAGVAAGDFSAGDGGFLHLVLTSVTGGNGGYSSCCPGGVGGPGLYIGSAFGPADGSCDVVIAGGGLGFVRGGDGGTSIAGCGGSSQQPGGNAITALRPKVRYSDVDLIPGVGCGGAGLEIAANPADVTAPGFADPTLSVSGYMNAGSVLTFRVSAHPRSKVFLNYGRTPIVRSDGLSQIDVLVDVIRGLKLGAVPPAGFVDRGFPIASNAALGDLFVFQAVVILPNGEMRRTNSVPVVVH